MVEKVFRGVLQPLLYKDRSVNLSPIMNQKIPLPIPTEEKPFHFLRPQMYPITNIPLFCRKEYTSLIKHRLTAYCNKMHDYATEEHSYVRIVLVICL